MTHESVGGLLGSFSGRVDGGHWTLCVSKHVVYDCVKLGTHTLKLGKNTLEKMMQKWKKMI